MAGENEFAELVKGALLASYNRVTELGEGAKRLDGEQRDLSTRADLEAGKTIAEFFKKANIPLVVFSEEHSKQVIGENPTMSIIFDDIDGTLNYRDGAGMLPHGTILGIFDSINPTFNDCIAAGFLEFNSGNLFYAIKGKGAFLIKGYAHGGDEKIRLQTSGRAAIRGKTFLRMIPDLYMLGSLARHITKFADRAWMKDFGSAATHLIMVASGAQDIYINADNCHIPEKKNTGEEQGPAYLIIKEAGGALMDWKGNDLGTQKISLDKKKTFDYIASATEELGKEFAGEIQKIPEIVDYIKKREKGD